MTYERNRRSRHAWRRFFTEDTAILLAFFLILLPLLAWSLRAF